MKKRLKRTISIKEVMKLHRQLMKECEKLPKQDEKNDSKPFIGKDELIQLDSDGYAN